MTDPQPEAQPDPLLPQAGRPATELHLGVNLVARSVIALLAARDVTYDSDTDTINRAVQVYAYLITAIADGASIHVHRPGEPGVRLDLL